MTSKSGGLSAEFIEWAASVKVSRRAGKALELLLEHGSVTTGDLKSAGYDHPPRAVRDLKDAGFAVESKNVLVEGKRMARYTLVDTITTDYATRRPIPLSFRRRLFEEHDFRCAVCGGQYIMRMLQADHRVPFHVGGDPEPFTIDDFMPLCGSDNRAKSMSCETCPNWAVRDPETCTSCYWHDPDHYDHVATVPERRVSLVFRDGDVEKYDRLRLRAETRGGTVNDEFRDRL